MTLLDIARQYVTKGFSVIPLKPNDKKPAIDSWRVFQEHKPTDDNLKLWFGNGSKNNIGIVTGAISGIAVVDLDTEEAVQFAKDNFSETPIVKTGKGYHVYYKYRDGIKNFQRRENLPGIDLRGDGGYVVAPPSIHETGKQYQWLRGKGLDDLPLAELPDIIFAKNGEDKAPLKELYHGVPEGSRNESLTRIIGSLVNDGVTFHECIEFAYLWNEKNIPPETDRGKIERTVRSIFEKHHRERSNSPDIYSKTIRPIDQSELLSSLLKWNDIFNLDVKTEYLLDKLIPKGSITMLFGRGGIGKTSLCLQIAKAIAEGKPFGDLKTIKTPVYYLDWENPLSVLKEHAERKGQADNLYVWHISNEIQPPKIDSKDWELYKKLPPGLIMIDTMRAGHLSDEDKSRDMAIILDRLKQLRENGFTIVFLQHTPKGNESIYKGSTAALDLADHVLGLEELKNDDTIEFGRENIYRFGTRMKTRYDPYQIFLRYNPDIKGFEIAKDPDYEIIEAIHELLSDKGELNTNQFYELVKKELDIKGKERVIKLLKKGEGEYWDIEKRGTAKYYKSKSPAIYNETIRPIDENGLRDSNPEPLQSFDDSIKSDSPGIPETDKTDSEIDLNGPNVEIIE